MSKPLLQVALDHVNIKDALESAKILKDHVDVLEAGTILCAAEGASAIRALRDLSPTQILLADYKVTDAGGTFAEIAFSQGATWLTVICAAPLPTMKVALECAKKYNGDIQIELYGNWNFNDAQDWLDIGLTQAVYHRGRDAQAAGQNWGSEDLDKIAKLSEMGLDVSVTGGLVPDDLHLFKNFSVKAFISGRSLYAATDPVQASKNFKAEINKHWS